MRTRSAASPRASSLPPPSSGGASASPAPAAAAAAPADAGDSFEPPKKKRGALAALRPFAKGFQDGAVHPVHVVQKERVKAGVGLAGLAVASAGFHMLGLPDPTLGIVAAGGAVVSYDAWQVGREFKRLPQGSPERTRVAGAVASKFGLWALTSTIAHFISPAEAHAVAQHAAHAPDSLSLAKDAAMGAIAGLTAGGDAVVFALDAADNKKKADAAQGG